MNAMVSMLVLLFIGQTVAFDLSKIWLPDDMIMESKFDIHVLAPAEIYMKGGEKPQIKPKKRKRYPTYRKKAPNKEQNDHTKRKRHPHRQLLCGKTASMRRKKPSIWYFVIIQGGWGGGGGSTADACFTLAAPMYRW